MMKRQFVKLASIFCILGHGLASHASESLPVDQELIDVLTVYLSTNYTEYADEVKTPDTEHLIVKESSPVQSRFDELSYTAKHNFDRVRLIYGDYRHQNPGKMVHHFSLKQNPIHIDSSEYYTAIVPVCLSNNAPQHYEISELDDCSYHAFSEFALEQNKTLAEYIAWKNEFERQPRYQLAVISLVKTNGHYIPFRYETEFRIHCYMDPEDVKEFHDLLNFPEQMPCPLAEGQKNDFQADEKGRYDEMSKSELQQVLKELQTKLFFAERLNSKIRKKAVGAARVYDAAATGKEKSDALFQMLEMKAESRRSSRKLKQISSSFREAQDAYVDLIFSESR